MRKALCLLFAASMALSTPVHAASYSYIRHQYNPKTLAHTKKKVTVKLPDKTFKNIRSNLNKILGYTCRTWHPTKVIQKGTTITLHVKAVDPSRYLQKGAYAYSDFDNTIYGPSCIFCKPYTWSKKKKAWIPYYDPDSRSGYYNYCGMNRCIFAHGSERFLCTKDNGGKYKLIYTLCETNTYTSWYGLDQDSYFDWNIPKKERNQLAYQFTVKKKKPTRYHLRIVETLV